MKSALEKITKGTVNITIWEKIWDKVDKLITAEANERDVLKKLIARCETTEMLFTATCGDYDSAHIDTKRLEFECML